MAWIKNSSISRSSSPAPRQKAPPTDSRAPQASQPNVGVGAFKSPQTIQAHSSSTQTSPIPSPEESAGRLHRSLTEKPTLPRAPRGTALQAAPNGSWQKADDQHPVYGQYLAQWLQNNEPEPGKALIGLFRTRIQELKAVVSRKKSPGKFKATGR